MLENRKILGLLGLFLLALTIGYYTWDGRNPTPISRAALYHDNILVNNNYILVNNDGYWAKTE